MLTLLEESVKPDNMAKIIKRRAEFYTGFHSTEHKYDETILLMKSRVTNLVIKFKEFLTTDNFAEAAIHAGQNLSASQHINFILFNPAKIKLTEVDPVNAHIAWEHYKYPSGYLRDIHFCNTLDKDLVVSVTFGIDHDILENPDSDLIKNAIEGACMLFMSKLKTCIELESGIEVISGCIQDSALRNFGWRLNLRNLV